ncbi:hypothetical protein [Helicobacter typhlonius]
MYAGLQASKGDCVALIDADLQCVITTSIINKNEFKYTLRICF